MNPKLLVALTAVVLTVSAPFGSVNPAQLAPRALGDQVGTEPVPTPASGDLNGDGIARVVAVGDSILEGAATSITEAFRGAGYDVVVDTAVSRSTLAGADVVRRLAASDPDAIVVMLGANDGGNPETYRTRVRAVLDAATGVPLLLWMTIPEVRDYYPAANQVLSEEMATRSGGSLLDWSAVAATAGVTASDGLHLTPAGIETMTGFVVASTAQALQTAWRGEAEAQAAAAGEVEARTQREAASQAPEALSGAGSGDTDQAQRDRARSDRTLVSRALDSLETLLGPGRVLAAGLIVALALASSGLAVALWSLWHTRRRVAIGRSKS